MTDSVMGAQAKVASNRASRCGPDLPEGNGGRESTVAILPGATDRAPGGNVITRKIAPDGLPYPADGTIAARVLELLGARVMDLRDISDALNVGNSRQLMSLMTLLRKRRLVVPVARRRYRRTDLT